MSRGDKYVREIHLYLDSKDSVEQTLYYTYVSLYERNNELTSPLHADRQSNDRGSLLAPHPAGRKD